jgi:hypothetical protein
MDAMPMNAAGGWMKSTASSCAFVEARGRVG